MSTHANVEKASSLSALESSAIRKFERLRAKGRDAELYRPISSFWLEKPAVIAKEASAQYNIQTSNASRNFVSEPDTTEGWRFLMTSDFKKAIAGLDKKLQGRILEAVVDLFPEPMRTRGDTIKPLTKELAGYWRYRIGDYRLIYWPDPHNRTVALVSVAPRGGAYH